MKARCGEIHGGLFCIGWYLIVVFGNLADYTNGIITAFWDNSGGLTAKPVINSIQSVVAGFIYVVQIWVRNEPAAKPAHNNFPTIFAKAFQSKHHFLLIQRGGGNRRHAVPVT